jgi:hypothetical protein
MDRILSIRRWFRMFAPIYMYMGLLLPLVGLGDDTGHDPQSYDLPIEQFPYTSLGLDLPLWRR